MANELNLFRAEKDRFFRSHPQSPLTAEQKRAFEGLNYFPYNQQLQMVVEVEEFPDHPELKIQTSTGDLQVFKRYGRFQFEVDGEPAELTIYYNNNGYFLPFIDSLSGKETYPAGRYLEIERYHDGRFLVDFNMAYNPYCAYNERWSCPLTPNENRLKVPIRAGEKIFKG